MEKFITVLAAAVAIPFAILALFLLFVYGPVGIYTEAECLRKGYPKYAVSVGLERYCMNLTGDVTIAVDKAGD